MPNGYYIIILLACIALAQCTDELLHDNLTVEAVPITALGGQPYYTQTPQPPPVFIDVPDTLEVGTILIGNYLTSLLPYKGVAIWSTASTSNPNNTPVGYLRLPGLLYYEYDRDSLTLQLSQFTAHYKLDLSTNPPTISGQLSPPENFTPYRFLSRTLGVISGYSYDNDYYFNCPNPDSILSEFRFEIINNPSCKYE